MSNLAPESSSVEPPHASLSQSSIPAVRRKGMYFVLEALNATATTLYFYYLFFFLQQQFGFSNKQNLVCAALSGGVYVVFSWYGGRFAQKHGYHSSLRLGFSVMLAALLFGVMVRNAPAQIFTVLIWTVGMSFTWPALEASASDNESRTGVQRMVGVYNLVWAASSAVAYFCGGAMLEKLGTSSMFLVPAALHGAQLVILHCGTRVRKPMAEDPLESIAFPASIPQFSTEAEDETAEPHPHPRAKSFLRMAWLANPFAYIAINSLVPTIPYVAKKLELSPMFAGFFCSIWLFARLGAFLGLWLWPGWHYRFRWLIVSYLLMLACFIGILLAPNLWLVIFAQVAFGLAVGLIYYSSLYYSMDAGETKGEHGGLHEAAIGLGNLAGPAVGATALHFLPASAQSGTWSIGGLLTAGFAVLLILGSRSKTAQ